MKFMYFFSHSCNRAEWDNANNQVGKLGLTGDDEVLTLLPWCTSSGQCPSPTAASLGWVTLRYFHSSLLYELLSSTIAKTFRNVPYYQRVNFLRAEVALLCTWGVASILHRARWLIHAQVTYEWTGLWKGKKNGPIPTKNHAKNTVSCSMLKSIILKFL